MVDSFNGARIRYPRWENMGPGSGVCNMDHSLGAYYQFIGCNSSAFFGVDSDLGFSNLGSLGDI
jgi:hypothetical protein